MQWQVTVFSSRGFAAAFPVFLAAASVCAYDGFDDFRRASGGIFALFDRLVDQRFPGQLCEIMVAGWSDENQRGEVLYRCTHDQSQWASPGAIYLLGDRTVMGPDEEDIPQGLFDPRRHGLAAMEAFRRRRYDLSCGQGEPVLGYSVGGLVSLGTVTASGVSIETIHEWPDVIGETIQPFREPMRQAA